MRREMLRHTYHRKAHAESARSLMLTMLGEFVRPEPAGVWTQTFVGAFEALGFAEGTARQTLKRSAEEGWIRSRRLGRRSEWHLVPATRAMLIEGSRRIYELGTRREPWSGRWLVLHLQLSDLDRRSRERLRRRLGWSGFGQLSTDCWISPHPDRAPTVLEILGEIGGENSLLIAGASLGPEDPRTIVEHAWNLDRLAETYKQTLDSMKGLRPRTPAATFAALTRLVNHWRRMPFSDPDLPIDLLPKNWPGHRAATRFAELHHRWTPTAQDYWQNLSQ